MTEPIEARLRKFGGVPPSVQREAAAEIDRLRAIETKYWQLIYAVATKHPDEDRHHTALRYIKNAENGGPISASGAEFREVL